jgi:hypothetical protein
VTGCACVDAVAFLSSCSFLTCNLLDAHVMVTMLMHHPWQGLVEAMGNMAHRVHWMQRWIGRGACNT